MREEIKDKLIFKTAKNILTNFGAKFLEVK